MEMLSGAEMVVRSLIDQGVKQVFGYPGGAVLDIYDALQTVGGIDHILVRHEQGAVHMADGLARATGEEIPEGGYPGEYVVPLAQRLLAERPEVLELPERERITVARELGYDWML